MKLLMQSTMVAAFALALCTGVYAFQRVADWGEPVPQTSEKAEFSWSRLAYTAHEAAAGTAATVAAGAGIGYGRGRHGSGIIRRRTGSS